MRWPLVKICRLVVVGGITLGFFVLVGVWECAAEESLVTDRPDFTESSSTVRQGVLQLEGGVTFASFQDGTDVSTVGEILARWGVAEKLELRFVLPTYFWERNGGADKSGFLSSGVGLKYELKQGSGDGLIGGMESALIVSTTVPTGTADFSRSSWQPAAVFAASWELWPNLGFGANFGVSRPADEDNRYTSLWVSGALSVGLSDTTAMFFELYGFNREEQRGPSTATFQTGLAYLLNSDLQLDVRAARRLTNEGVDFLIGAGLSWRIGG
jgi:hypothetical protein